MANDRFKNYSFEFESNLVPVAIALPASQEVVVGSIVKLDGRSSVDPEGSGLTYVWTFVQVPIGSQVAAFGFTNLEEDASIVSYAPDLPGTYKIDLTVSDGSLVSQPSQAVVDTRIILIPNHQGLTPDASFIWNYLSDFWTKVDGRKKFETFWSAAIQITAAEMLKLYQYDYNKSIRDIQEVFQRRWLAYSPSLLLTASKCKFILADDIAGVTGSTLVLDPVTKSFASTQPARVNSLSSPIADSNFTTTPYGSKVLIGKVLALGDRGYTHARSATTAGSVLSSPNGYVDLNGPLQPFLFPDPPAFPSGPVPAGNPNPAEFLGTGFHSGLIGFHLTIVSGLNAGVYLIQDVLSSHALQVVGLDGFGPTFVEETNISYYITSETANSTFFSDLQEIPGSLLDQSWRLSSTLISAEHDFEKEGVSPGDLLEIEIGRVGTSTTSPLIAQVIAVDRNRLSFTLDPKELVAGVASGWLSESTQVQLAADLKISGLAVDQNGVLAYLGESALIRSTLLSKKFRRDYFEKELYPHSEINVGAALSITARPVQVIRHSKIPVSDKIVSVPVLQEYIRQPDVLTTDNGIVILTEGGQSPATRAPFLLVENLDYIVDGEKTITGTCNVIGGFDEIEVSLGDLIDRSVKEGDRLTTVDGAVEVTYDVRRVLSSSKLRVYPTPSKSLINATYTITRRVVGKYLRFVNKMFSRATPAPERLWAEVTYLDNNSAIENNFGVLVGLSKESMEKAGSVIPYRSAVAGLMYALVSGPTISNLALSAQILLGLPFTQNAGVITEINPDYRRRVDGSPLLGRILVEAQDSSGNSLGITNIYFYPQGRQIFDEPTQTWSSAVPEFSGLGTNPKTGTTFAVGDSVAQFIMLSKGVQVQEYLETPEWTQQLEAQGKLAAILQRYHSFQLIINSDLVSAADIDLSAGFMRKAKPHYLKLTAALLKSLEDFVLIEDSLIFTRQAQLFESIGLGLPSALKFDGRDENGSIIEFSGNAYTRYLSGEDLAVTKDSLQVTSAAGGLIDARFSYNESHDKPFLRAGDLLCIKESDNAGRYLIDNIDSDTAMTLAAGVNFETLSDLPFSVYRPLKNPIWAGKINIVTGDGLVVTKEAVGTQGGIQSAGVAVGDSVVFFRTVGPTTTQSRKIYTVVEVVPDPVTPYIRVTPDPLESTDEYTAWVIREPLMTRNLVEPYGVASPIPLIGDMQAGQSFVLWQAMSDEGWLTVNLLRRGDLLTYGGTSFEVLSNDPLAGKTWISQAAPVTVLGASFEGSRDSAPLVPISIDTVELLPEDTLELDFLLPSVGDGLLTFVGSPDVQTSAALDFADLGVVPGDFIIVLQGVDSLIDVGYGPGVFSILNVMTSTLRLTQMLTATVAAPGVQYGFRRKR